MKKTKTWTIPIESLSGTDDVFITIPNEILKKFKWKEGDEIAFKAVEDGYELRKVNDTK